MYDESSNISSSASFTKLRQECFRLVYNFSSPIDRYQFPNIATLADEHKAKCESMSLEDFAIAHGKNNKIAFIKDIRERYQRKNGEAIGLLEAKLIADGIFQRLGWGTYNI